MEDRKLKVSEKNLKLIRTLVMYADDDISFFREIKGYLLELGNQLPFEQEQKYRDTIFNMCELIAPVFKDN